MEGSRGHDEDGGVDEECETQRGGGVDGAVEDGVAHLGGVVAVQFAGEDDGGVEEEVVRHHRRADDADGDEQHVAVP